eukprot:scaffold54581_cov48-Phaeocystis_antarctica.AAC.1
MSKDKEGMGSEARIALNLHKRPRRRERTWSVGIGEGCACGDKALYIFSTFAECLPRAPHQIGVVPGIL